MVNASEIYTTLVSGAQLARHLADPRWVIIDCRFNLLAPQAGGADYAQAHLPGARYAHLDRDLAGPIAPGTGRHPLPDPEALVVRLGGWGVDPETQVVVYDDCGGAIAVRLWWMLRWLGHPAVAVLDGGLAAWQAVGLSVNSTTPHPVTTRFEIELQVGSQLSMEQVRAGLRAGSICLVDARTAARFAGEVEPIDPVAGHIPTALNYPYEANLTSAGRFLAPELLRTRFASLASQPERVVHMCGSGVTACHNLLAMEVAGLTGSKLYAGSWSEWVRDPRNPVATGDEA